MSIVLQNPGQKDKILWALVDENGHTVIQVYSHIYPKELEEVLNRN